MLRFKVRGFASTDWDQVVNKLTDLSLLQTWEYAEAKAAAGPWRAERGVFVDCDNVVGACQALVRRLPIVGGGLVWINRGPLWRRPGGDNNQPRLSAMLAVLKRHYTNAEGMYLRIAPPVPADSIDAMSASSAGLLPAGTAGWASALLDLGANEDVLRANLGAKWRGHLNKAERAGLRITCGSSESNFSAFLARHDELIARKDVVSSLTPDLLTTMQALLPLDRRMEAFLAYHNDELVGSTLVAKYGDTCEYLAANITFEGRRLNAGQLLLWSVIRDMKTKGFRRLDLSGMDPDVTPEGIYKFKRGVGGVSYRLAPELEAGGGGIIGGLVRWRVECARAAG